MNLFFLLEGRSTERQVYRAWLKVAFPQLTEASTPGQVTTDHFYLFSANGQPAIFHAIDDTIHDLCDRPVFDHLFICLDAEESTLEAKLRETRDAIDASTARHNQHQHAPALQIHPIVQHCCIETWFLGNADLMPPSSKGEPLRTWQQTYDVRTRDPERMPALMHYRIRAHFHHDYLCEMVKERTPHRYSKTRPGPVLHPTYLAALIRRHRETGHITSLGELVRVWESLGATLST